MVFSEAFLEKTALVLRTSVDGVLLNNSLLLSGRESCVVVSLRGVTLSPSVSETPPLISWGTSTAVDSSEDGLAVVRNVVAVLNSGGQAALLLYGSPETAARFALVFGGPG